MPFLKIQLAGCSVIVNIALMFRTHFWKLLLFSLALSLTLPCAAETLVSSISKKGGKKIPFKLSHVIHPRVDKMPEPKMYANIVGEKIAITASTQKARDHVKQGFALVHAQWDFEAYRHFCAALKEDPECLMAYCGVTLALAQPYNEYSLYRMAAVNRMQDLMERDDRAVKAGKVAKYPVLEKKFAFATATLVAESPRRAGVLYAKLGEEFPQFLQAQLLGQFLTRGGYDILGSPAKSQKRAVALTKKLLDENPENPLVLGFWLSLNAEAPRQAVNIKKEILSYARALVKKCPDVPSWQTALGHFEWRAGNYLLAERAFKKSAELYENWMKQNHVSMDDCEGYVRAKCYLANTHYQRGNYLKAMEVAKELRAIALNPKRPRSQGNMILLWRAYTLPARLYIAHGADGDLDRALASFPKKEEIKAFVAHPKYPTLAGVYMEALSAYIGSRKALADGARSAAKILHTKTFRRYLLSLAAVAEGARHSPEFIHYFNAGSSLAIYDMELAGLRALYGEKELRITASNWFRSARDKQGVPGSMMPPLVITPMENRLAEYYLAVGKESSAYKAYQEGLLRYPNNMDSLRGVEKCLRLLGKKEAAARVKKHMRLVRGAH